MLELVLFFFTICNCASVEVVESPTVYELDPLSFNTAFYSSEMVAAITMPCGSPGLQSCTVVKKLLESFSKDSLNCSGYVLFAVIDQSKFVSDGGAASGLWYRRTYLIPGHGKEMTDIDIPPEGVKFNCG